MEITQIQYETFLDVLTSKYPLLVKHLEEYQYFSFFRNQFIKLNLFDLIKGELQLSQLSLDSLNQDIVEKMLQTKRYNTSPYNLLQHSLNVYNGSVEILNTYHSDSPILYTISKLWALVHDVSEVFLGDLIYPVKQFLNILDVDNIFKLLEVYIIDNILKLNGVKINIFEYLLKYSETSIKFVKSVDMNDAYSEMENTNIPSEINLNPYKENTLIIKYVTLQQQLCMELQNLQNLNDNCD